MASTHVWEQPIPDCVRRRLPWFRSVAVAFIEVAGAVGGPEDSDTTSDSVYIPDFFVYLCGLDALFGCRK